jgi:purine-nucleoside phosphorylase
LNDLQRSDTSNDDYSRAQAAADFISGKTALRPHIALVLGSGLGAYADSLADSARISYGDIPGFPRSTAEGHAGQLVIGKTASGVPVAAMQGRAHFYEGHTMKEITFPIRAFRLMGVRAAILTNAAGGINVKFGQGALVALSDHINLQGPNPLIGPNDARFGPRFPDMTTAYWKPYRTLTLEEGKRLGIEMHEGTYAALAGPMYETPAEIRYLRTIGADMVGMSTVPEAIVAAHMGMRVLAISCVTNMAAGILDRPLNHEEVLETGRRVQGQFLALLEAVIPRIAQDVQPMAPSKS